MLTDESTILTRTTIWAGGLKASNLSGALGIGTGHGDRIEVQPDFSVKDFPGVYALGDFANISGVDGKPLPQLASVAQQAGRHCADAIAASIAGDPVKPFRYFDMGIMAMIGRNAAVTDLGEHRHELTGPLAFAAAGWVVITVEETTLAQGNRFRAAAAAASALAYRRFLHQPVRHLLLLVQHSGRVQSFPRALGLA